MVLGLELHSEMGWVMWQGTQGQWMLARGVPSARCPGRTLPPTCPTCLGPGSQLDPAGVGVGGKGRFKAPGEPSLPPATHFVKGLWEARPSGAGLGRDVEKSLGWGLGRGP